MRLQRLDRRSHSGCSGLSAQVPLTELPQRYDGDGFGGQTDRRQAAKPMSTLLEQLARHHPPVGWPARIGLLRPQTRWRYLPIVFSVCETMHRRSHRYIARMLRVASAATLVACGLERSLPSALCRRVRLSLRSLPGTIATR
jgi:hypothetical protein